MEEGDSHVGSSRRDLSGSGHLPFMGSSEHKSRKRPRSADPTRRRRLTLDTLDGASFVLLERHILPRKKITKRPESASTRRARPSSAFKKARRRKLLAFQAQKAKKGRSTGPQITKRRRRKLARKTPRNRSKPKRGTFPRQSSTLPEKGQRAPYVVPIEDKRPETRSEMLWVLFPLDSFRARRSNTMHLFEV